jgi:hypothetical protein
MINLLAVIGALAVGYISYRIYQAYKAKLASLTGTSVAPAPAAKPDSGGKQ